MKVLIEAPFTLSSQDKIMINTQVKDLEKYHNNITQAEVYFKTDDGSKPDSILAEIQLHVPGPVIFVSDTDQDFQKAFSGSLHKAKRQLKKAKDMMKDHSI